MYKVFCFFILLPQLCFAGVGSGGGLNGINGRPLEDYKIKITNERAYKKIVEPMLGRLHDLELLDLETLFREFLEKKNWYVAPVELEPLKNVGVSFKTGQYGLQNATEVWLKSKFYKDKKVQTQAKAIIHELLMGLKVHRKFVDTDCRPILVCDTKSSEHEPSDRDTQQVRNMTNIFMNDLANYQGAEGGFKLGKLLSENDFGHFLYPLSSKYKLPQVMAGSEILDNVIRAQLAAGTFPSHTGFDESGKSTERCEFAFKFDAEDFYQRVDVEVKFPNSGKELRVKTKWSTPAYATDFFLGTPVDHPLEDFKKVGYKQTLVHLYMNGTSLQAYGVKIYTVVRTLDLNEKGNSTGYKWVISKTDPVVTCISENNLHDLYLKNFPVDPSLFGH